MEKTLLKSLHLAEVYLRSLIQGEKEGIVMVPRNLAYLLSDFERDELLEMGWSPTPISKDLASDYLYFQVHAGEPFRIEIIDPRTSLHYITTESFLHRDIILFLALDNLTYIPLASINDLGNFLPRHLRRLRGSMTIFSLNTPCVWSFEDAVSLDPNLEELEDFAQDALQMLVVLLPFGKEVMLVYPSRGMHILSYVDFWKRVEKALAN